MSLPVDCSFTPTTRIMCENQGPLTITCSANQHIHIVDGFYGRTVPYTDICPISSSRNANTNCISQTSITKVR